MQKSVDFMKNEVYNWSIQKTIGDGEDTKSLPTNKKEESRMKKIISLVMVAILLCCSAFALASCADEEETFVVAMSPDFAPMEFVDTTKSGNDKYVGFDVLLANYIAKDLGKKLIIKPMSFDACMAAVQAGNVDAAISGFSWTAERAEKFEITDYYVAGENETEQVLLTTAANAGQWTTADAYNGKRIGAQGGSLQELLVNEQLVNKGATLVKYENIDMAYAALMNGSIDALAVAKGNGDALIASTDEQTDNTKKGAFAGFDFVVEEKYKNNVILLQKGNTALLEAVNASLAKAMEADLYDAWYEACLTYGDVTSIDEYGYTDDGKKIVGFDENDEPIVDENYVAGEASAEDAAKKVAYEKYLKDIIG